MKQYQDDFDVLLSKVDLTEQQAIRFYIGGLQPEVEMVVRMFNPKTLTDTYLLAKLQEATLNAAKKKFRPLLPTPSHKFGSNHVANDSSSYAHKPFPAIQPPNLPPKSSPVLTNVVPRRQMSQKEFDEKRAKNWCFYCERYTPVHNCRGKMFALEVLAPEEMEEMVEGVTQLEIQQNDVQVEDETECPHISLNAFMGVATYQTMRVRGQVNKNWLHILIDSDSTHNLLDLSTAKKLGCQIKKTCPLPIDIAGGKSITSEFKCKNFSWKLRIHY